jgi:hypothetical protein
MGGGSAAGKAGIATLRGRFATALVVHDAGSAEQFLQPCPDHRAWAMIGPVRDHESPGERRTELRRYVGRYSEEPQSPCEAIPTLAHRLRFSGAVLGVTIAQEEHEVAGERVNQIHGVNRGAS